MRCEIDDAHLFLQVIRERRDPRGILREALSNAHDAGASRVRVEVRPKSRDSLDLVIEDNGVGIPRNRFRHFFGLGLSTKRHGSFIGNKGLGTKLYFNSRSIRVETRTKEGREYVAEIDEPLKSLEEGQVPSFRIQPRAVTLRYRSGTRVVISGIPVSTQSSLLSSAGLASYLRWFTAAGSAHEVFGEKRRGLRTELVRHHVGKEPTVEVISGHVLPEPNTEVVDPADFAYCFDPFTFWARNSEGKPVTRVDVAGAIVGAAAHVVADRRMKKQFKGIFLCKDYFAVRAVNEEVTGNSGEWQSYHILINCQDLSLNMGREDFVDTAHDSVYGCVLDAIRHFVRSIQRGERFRYYGEDVEVGEQFAGRGYAAYRGVKAEWAQVETENRITFNVLDLGNREQLPTSLAGGPHFEPQEKYGTLMVLQSILTNSALRNIRYDLSAAYRLLSFTPEDGGLVLLQSQDGRGSQPPRFFLLQHTANVKHVRNAAKQGLGGVVCWDVSPYLFEEDSLAKEPYVEVDGLEILILRNMVALEAGG